MQLANRLGYFPEYIFSRLAKTVKEVEAKSGRKVLNFGIGSPDFPPSKIYLNKLAQFYQDPNAHIYPGYGAIPEFTSAVINWYQKRFQVNLAENELFPLLGSKEGIAYLVLALTNPGDEILVPDPGYPSFAATALMFKVKPVYYNLTKANNFKPVLKELEKLVNKKTKLIWVNFPSNPTGQVINLKELGMIAEFAYKHRIYLAYDNAYAEITFGKYIAPSILQIKRVKNFVIELQSLSKTFSFAGFRIGWLAGSSQIVTAIAKIKSQFDPGLSHPLQKLAAYAFTNNDAIWHQRMIKSYLTRMRVIAQKLTKLGLKYNKPRAALYIWAQIPDNYQNSEKYSLELLQNKQVLMTPGTAFGNNGNKYVRVSICVNIKNIDTYL